jgi:ubiquinone/menaquinone biosynthesis C-methylase UbiE
MKDKFDFYRFGARVIKRFNLAAKRDRQMAKLVTPYLKANDSVLDIGCGLGRVTKIIKDKGHKIVALDVRDLSIVDDICPVLYDGKKIPFTDNSFDVSLIVTVLHHTADPEAILKEAKRVSKKIIIVEDIYKNNLQKQFTFFNDSVLNFEFFGHPHSNKDDSGWKETFDKLKLKLIDDRSLSIRMILHGIYCLES